MTGRMIDAIPADLWDRCLTVQVGNHQLHACYDQGRVLEWDGTALVRGHDQARLPDEHVPVDVPYIVVPPRMLGPALVLVILCLAAYRRVGPSSES